MTLRPQAELDPRYGEEDDTDPEGLAKKIPPVRWYLRTTRSFGRSRWFFMPVGFLCLGALAFHLGAPAMENLTGLLLLGLHKLLVGLGRILEGVTGANLDHVLGLTAREAATPVLAAFWATAVTIKIALSAWPLPEREGDLGYVVPGSGFWARLWGILGRRIHQAKQGLKHMAAYLRDINLEKIYLPVCVLILLPVSGASLYLAVGNLLFEVPARIEGMQGHTTWITMAAGCTTVVVILVLGFPMVVNTLVRVHQRSVGLREKKVKQIRRRLRGLLGTVFVLLPIAWAGLFLLAGGW